MPLLKTPNGNSVVSYRTKCWLLALIGQNPKRGEEMFGQTDRSLGKPKPVTKSYGYEDAMQHGYLTEMEKQWLYWREAARREAERAKPWNTHKG